MFTFFLNGQAFGQALNPNLPEVPFSDSLCTPDYRRLHRIFAVQSAVYLGSVYVLSKSWYKNALTDFHIRDDRQVWMQLDKAGHFFTAFQISQFTSRIYRSTGINRKQQILYGALSGFVFQTPIELLDGFSPDYGFSPSDVAANFVGSAFYVGQMFAWDEPKILPKFSARLTPFARVRPELLGENLPERLLKDYNGQTYWLSASPGALFSGTRWPDWLCISVGYGIERMVAAQTGQSAEMGYNPCRQFYLSLDLDLSRISFRSRFMRNTASLLNTIKIPCPTLEVGQGGKVSFRGLYF